MEKKSSGLIVLISLLLIMVVKVHGTDTQLKFEFEYEGARGPSHWGDLKEEWKACGNGKEQSPIDLAKKNIEIFPSLGKLQRNYRAANASLKNRGHDIMSTESPGEMGRRSRDNKHRWYELYSRPMPLAFSC